MTDLTTLKSTYSLLALLPDLKKIGPNYYGGPCPFCGGKDRFQIKQTDDGDLWICRHCAGDRYHDAVDFLARRENVDPQSPDKAIRSAAMKRIIEIMGGQVDRTVKSGDRITQPVSAKEPPAEDWQTTAVTIMNWSKANLWSENGYKALEWLRGPQRCLSDSAILTWDLGFSPGRKVAGTWVERGIVIPVWSGDGVLWDLKIRRADGNPKYRHVKGSRPALFGSELCLNARTVFLTEGEFDAMLLWSVLAYMDPSPGVCTMGAITNRLDVATWGWYLQTAETIIACYDMDEAGSNGFKALVGASGRIRRAEIPIGKDITDYVKAGGDLAAWVNFQMEIPC